MPNLNFQVLFPKNYPQMSIGQRDRRFQINGNLEYLFVTNVTRDIEESRQTVVLMAATGCNLKLTAELDIRKVLTIKNTGDHPIHVIEEGKLIAKSEMTLSKYNKMTIFFLSIDAHDDKVKVFKLVFDSQEDSLIVTLE